MIKEIWINLPVKDIKKATQFFKSIGFTINPHYNSEGSASFFIGEKKIVLMLFNQEQFKSFTRANVADTGTGTEVLFSIDAESPAEVDEMAGKAEAAGGIVFGKPAEIQGWMYGCGFTDLDGHRWNVLHMDMSKMPK